MGFVEGFSAEMVKFRCNGVDWAVDLSGRGTPIVFLHGFPFDRTMYSFVAPLLSDKCRVIVPDLPGFGESRFSSGEIPDQFRMEDYADGLASLLDELEEAKAVICGLSMGGYIAMQFFRRHPDRLLGLIFCDTRSTPDTEDAAERRKHLADSVYQTGTLPLAEQMVPNLCSPSTIANKADIVLYLREMILRQDPSGVAAAARGMAVRDDSTPYLSGISVPAIALGGNDDCISPPEVMSEMATSINGCESVTIPESGHLPPLENPRFFAATVRNFIDRLCVGN